MAGFLTGLANLLRTLVWLAVLVLIGFGGWLGYRAYDDRSELSRKVAAQDEELAKKSKRIEQLSNDVAAKQRRIEKLDLALRLLKIDRRVAEMFVLEQWRSQPTDKLMTKFQFTEVDGNGQKLAEPKVFTIEGDTVYIDAWVVKYSDELVEAGDPLRGASVFVFRRVFGEKQEPSKGFALDDVGRRPAAYGQQHEASDIEKEIWTNFWDFANDPQRAQQAGVRAAHGEAPSIQLREGKLYRVTLRSSGGLNIVPEDLPKEKAKPL